MGEWGFKLWVFPLEIPRGVSIRNT